MTIPATVYQAHKFADDFKTSKQTVDTNSIINRALTEGRSDGKGLFRQVAEYLRLLNSPGGLDLPDYYIYRLFDDSRYTFAEKQRFVSDRFYFKVIEKCCDKRWWILVDDKYWTDTVLRANGFPVAETQAVFSEGGRDFGNVQTLCDLQGLRDYLQHDARLPVYSKPINGLGSFGNFLIDEVQGDAVLLHDGQQMQIPEFARQVERSIGQLFQSTLRSHSELVDVCERVSTVRLILILTGGDVKILSAVWKIPVAQNIADNFWREGNSVGSVDPATGIVERAVGYVDRVPEEIDPESHKGAALIGRRLPNWDTAIDICKRGARLFAPLKFQGWDIAFTDSGPVVVEVNPGSSFILSQLASGKGFLTDEFHAFLVERGYPLKSFR